MASVIKIKNSTGSVLPTGLTFGEPAFVQGTGLTANRLYMGNSTSTSIWVGAEISTTGTWTDTAAKTTLATQYATDQRISSQISGSGVSSFNGLTGTVQGVSAAVGSTYLTVSGSTGSVTFTNTGVQTFNGLTGAVTGLTSGGPLGTPASGTLTNCTGLPVSSGISGLCGGIASFLAQSTSANLAAAMSDETGTGFLVFATNPILTTPNLGTPTTLVGTNITGTAAGFTVGSASLATNSLSLGGTAASGWAQLVSPTFTGTVNTSNLIVGGDLTVTGTTTTINSTTLTINDFNIIVGATLSGTGATGAAIATGAGIAVGTGTGISFAYEHSSTSWLSTVDLNILTGKTYKIAGTSVLSATTLGTGVVTSSLTSVGTLTTFVIDAGTF
jgi:hypothetical protein